MKLSDPNDPFYRFLRENHSRRHFINRLGLAAAGLFLTRYGLADNLLQLPII